MQLVLTAELLLAAYAEGLFPMAYSAGSPFVHWICPENRGQLSIEGLHVPRSLKRLIKQEPFEIRVDSAFEAVIRGCAESTPGRPETWINENIIKAFCDLYRRGDAHSIECWADGALVGGVYGLAIGGAFFGESMFSRHANASKVALVHLAARLWAGGFTLLDTQFVNPHLAQFGVYEIPHAAYMEQLEDALVQDADFTLEGRDDAGLMRDYLVFRSES